MPDAPLCRSFSLAELLSLQDEPLISKPPDEDATFADGIKLLHRLQSPPFDSDRWIFRGQVNERWRLEPSLERMYTQTLANQVRVEACIVEEFCRRAHHYMSNPPNREQLPELLALVRHHGGPTRLLDWTKSPYVAAFFAAAEADLVTTSAIWAIDLYAIREAAAAVFADYHPEVPPDLSDIKTLMTFTFPPLIIPIEPSRFNERLLAQQGLFLCPNTLEFPFDTCLKYLVRRAEEITEAPVLRKISLTPSARPTLMNELYRMNISESSLYPGIDGFIRSLATRERYKALRDNESAGA